MKRAVLITRPLEQSLDFARDLAAWGHECRVEPLLEIVPVAYSLSRPVQDYGGVIVTSLHAIPALSEMAVKAGYAGDKYQGVRLPPFPLYVVGERVAQALREAGFQTILACTSTARDLFNHIALEVPAGGKPLLYLQGEDTAFPMVESLADIGISCESVVVYEAVSALEFSPETYAALDKGEIEAVTLFSARSARVFAGLYERAFKGREADFKVLCFSNAVLECVRPLMLKQVYVCAEPSRESMVSLIRAHSPAMPDKKQGIHNMTQTQNNDTLGNAEEIIERFGGIRPMSTKTNIPVTTIQGWKKRGAIPLTRLDDLLKAAKSHDVRLEDLLNKTGAPANQNAGLSEKVEKPVAAKPEAVVEPVSVRTEPQKISVSQPSYASSHNPPRMGGTDEREKLKAAMIAERQKTLVQSVITSAVLVAVIGGVAAVLIWPLFEDTARTTRENSQTIASLQQDVTSVKGELEEQKSLFSGFLPGDWQKQLDALKEQAAAAQEGAAKALETAEQVSNDVLGENAGSVQQRLDALGQHLSVLTSSPLAQSLMTKFGALEASAEGSGILDQSVEQLNALLGSASSPIEGVPTPLGDTLETARTQSTTLGKAFEGVPQEDLKAAALLLGFSQFRSALGRDNESFAGDVSLLKTLLGQDNPALSEAIDRLAPKAADQGVLTPAGLTSELQAMTGDIVVASLKGEDVSVTEKAQARFGDILKVEKDGEMITGTPVQQKLSKTQALMQDGQLEQAIAVASTLEGPAGQMIQPWLEKARRTLQAQNLGQLIEAGVTESLSGATSAANGLPLGGRLIEDEASGIILYRPGPKLPKFTAPQTP